MSSSDPPPVKPPPIMTEEAYQNNVSTLKRLGWRGVRSIAVIVSGLTAFHFARQYRKGIIHQLKEAKPAEEFDAATDRYLKEMGSLGWPVEENEAALKGNKKK